MSFSPEMPKLASYYSNKMVKNIYQPFYDLVNAQSIWTDAMSNWFTQANKEAVKMANQFSWPSDQK